MMISFALFPLLAVITSGVQNEAWDLKPPYTENTVYVSSWKGTLKQKEDTFTIEYTSELLIRSVSAEGYRGELFQKDFYFNDEPEGWEDALRITLDSRGAILDVEDEDPYTSLRRLQPAFFIYPEKPVKPGDSWRYTSEKLDCLYHFEAKGIEKLQDTETLRVVCVMKENKKDGFKGTAIHWVTKEGIVLKSDLSFKNWRYTWDGEPAEYELKTKFIKTVKKSKSIRRNPCMHFSYSSF